MTDPVNGDSGLRAGKIVETEEKIVRAATDLFLERGYAATTLTDVAEVARVAARTVYVRFGTKAALMKRVIDVAIVGDTAPVDVLSRDWFQASLTAPTVEERVAAMCRSTRDIMDRAGALFAVGHQAAAVEPEIAAAEQAGRVATRAAVRIFWSHMEEDGLLASGCDVSWLRDTTSFLIGADSYRLMTQIHGWTADAYEEWLRISLSRLILASSGSPGGPMQTQPPAHAPSA